MISLKEIAEKIQGDLTGNGLVAISGISGIHEAKEGDITFLVDNSFKKYLKECKASAIILGKDINPDEFKGKNIIVTKNPALAYAKVAEIFHPRKINEKGISPSAFVAKTSQISDDAIIYPFAYIGEKTIVEKKVVVYPFVHIGDEVTIGEETVIYPHAVIYDKVIIGKRVIIHGGTVLGSDGFGYIWDGEKHVKIPQIGIVEIEDDVEIGANVTIDRASLGKTLIKKGAKIDNLVQIAHNVSIGENSIIVSQVGIAGSSTIGNNVVLAGQVGVRDHVVIGNNVKAAGGTGITKNVPENSLISGNPHMPHKEWLRFQGHLKNLPKLNKRIKRIEMKLQMEVDND
ncbi:MAG: UDP-3-O-(3-hydroxymyristoyl)glucosamine N-acyltransferase [Proteobacteria bacterium]|nr:UDP-3-O-(3-hydroxymyristoyl)glucosamine N-acyltransferase [Pseudomonadota bacterium]